MDLIDLRPLSYATCPSKVARGWTAQLAAWHELVDLLTRHDVREEKDGPLWSPVSIRETSSRKNESVDAVHLAVLDFDCGKSLEEVLPALDGFEMVVHTSHSHSPEVPKFRVVLPFTEPVPATRWKSWWTAFVAERAPDCDQACKNANRIYYLPSCPEESYLDAIAAHYPGAWLDPAPWLHDDPDPAPQIPAKPSARPTGRGDYTTLDVQAWAEAKGLKPRAEGSGEGKVFVDCPWKHEHTGGAQGPLDTYLLQKGDGGKPVFKCSHSHCQGRGFWDLLATVGDADRFCQQRFEPPPPPLERGEGAGLSEATPEEVGAAIQSIAAPGVEWDPVDGHGNPKCGVANALRFLRAAFAERTMRYNELDRQLEIDGVPLDEPAMAKQRERLEIVSGQTKWSQNHMDTAVQIIVSDVEKYHPVREYLRGLVWDGIDRIADLMNGPISSPNPLHLHQRYLEIWFISAVARALQPGCKVDTALILQGPQGVRKSSFFKCLVPREAWFSDDMGSLENKDSQMAVGRCWIIEWGELESLRRSNLGAVKAFLARQTDSFRPPYGRSFVDIPRSSVIVGSTNEAQFLHDPTGSRRFLVIPTTGVDTDAVAGMRDQLWAEAVYRYRSGERWHLNQEETKEQADQNEELTSEDPWHPVLERWLRLPDGADFSSTFGYFTSLTRILSDCLDIPAERRKRDHQTRIAQILATLGWRHAQRRNEGRREWVYAAPEGFVRESLASW